MERERRDSVGREEGEEEKKRRGKRREKRERGKMESEEEEDGGRMGGRVVLVVQPVDGGSTDGGDGGVDPRPEHRHPPVGAVGRTQDQQLVLGQVGPPGHTADWVR